MKVMTTKTYLINDAVARSSRAEGTTYAAEPNRGARPERRGRRTCGTSTEVARTYAARRPAAATAAGGIYEMGSSVISRIAQVLDPMARGLDTALASEEMSVRVQVGLILAILGAPILAMAPSPAGAQGEVFRVGPIAAARGEARSGFLEIPAGVDG